MPGEGVAIEVEVDDVLVLLRRVLGVLDRAVGAPVEPLGMLLDPRMVRRGVQRDVERDLETVVARGRDEPVEILQRPKLGMHREVPPFRRPDRVGAARIVRTGIQRVVAPLAVGPADRVDRREIQHVEPQIPHIGKPRNHVVERAVPVRIARHRPREHLVPGAERRREPIRKDRQHLVAREVCARPRPPHQLGGLLAAEKGEPLGMRHQLGIGRKRALQRLRVAARHTLARRRGLDQAPALLELERDVETGRVLLRDLIAPGRVEIAPGQEAALVKRVLRQRDRRAPPVVDDERHRHLDEGLLAALAENEGAGDRLVPVRKDVGLDVEGAPGDHLGRETSAVDLDVDAFDRDPVRGQREQGRGAVVGALRLRARPAGGSRGLDDFANLQSMSPAVSRCADNEVGRLWFHNRPPGLSPSPNGTAPGQRQRSGSVATETSASPAIALNTTCSLPQRLPPRS